MAKVGDVLDGRWLLERVIGRGGLATVYAARGRAGERVAVKVLRSDLSVDSAAVERFLREAYLASLIAHPGAVRVFGGSARGKEAYLVMELLDGETLEQRLANGRVSLFELLDWADQILDVLSCVHAAGIVHRDIKPSNLFITRSGRVKVLDFGAACLMRDRSPSRHCEAGAVIGSPPYMSPEQASGRHAELDGRSDLFGLGVTLFRSISGRFTHDARGALDMVIAMATQSAPPLASVAPNTPREICALVDTATGFYRFERYRDAAAMQSAVRHALGRVQEWMCPEASDETCADTLVSSSGVYSSTLVSACA